MKRLVLLVLLLSLPLVVSAYDKEKAIVIFKKCALCHSHYGQGIPGGRYPRLSGMDEEYMVQALKDFKDGTRWDTAMSVISGLQSMSEEEMEAVAEYIAGINLDEHDPYFDVHHGKGSVDKGEEIFQDECKTCHGKKAEGKPKKGAPFLRGQYSEYMERQLALFGKKERHHDRDPEDETFKEYSKEDLNNVIAYVASLDDKEKPVVPVQTTQQIMKQKEAKGDHVFGITQTVLKMPLNAGVSVDDA
jgi:cytochrome c553